MDKRRKAAMRGKIIVVGGYCAAGKSTFSRKLSGMLKIPCFNKDTLKEALGDGFGPGHNMVEQKGSAAAFLLLLHIAERFLETGNPCILESNFKAREIGELKALLERYGGECLTVIFTGDLGVLFTRYMERHTSEKRHWVHSTVGENRDNFREGHLCAGIGEAGIGRTITVDATSFAEVDYERLFAAVKDFMMSENE